MAEVEQSDLLFQSGPSPDDETNSTGPSEAIHDLASLIYPETPDFLYEHFLRKIRFHITAAERERGVTLLPWRVINQIVGANILPPERLRLFRSGNALPPAMYRTAGGKGALRPAATQDLLRQGSTVVLDGIDDLVPPIGRLTAAIERELSCAVWTNAYLSVGAGGASNAHYDPHDVLILQIYGRKRWQSFGTHTPYPLDASAKLPVKEKVVWEGVLEPGDVLYLPRGEVHLATIEGDHSVHLTIALQPCRGVDFAAAIVTRAAEDSLFREDVPVAAGKAAIAGHEASLKKALHALIDRMELSDFLDAGDRARPLRPLTNMGVCGPLKADTLLEPALRRRLRFDSEVEGDIEILAGGERFCLPRPTCQVLQFLMQQGECRFGAVVAAFEGQMSEAVVQRAVDELARQSLVGIRGGTRD